MIKLLTSIKRIWPMVFLSLFCFGGHASGQNLLTNGNFEAGYTGWNNLSGGGGIATYTLSTTDKYEGAQAMKVVVSKAGLNPYDIQTLGPRWAATVGKVYSISFWAKSDIAGASLNIVQQNAAWSSKSVSLTTGWAKYEYSYTALETSPSFRIQFPVAGTFWIDVIQVTDYVPPVQSTTDQVTILPATKFQTMVGFGGALTWFCPRVVKSSKKAEIVHLLFNDLGADIIRFKNWYYPANYPADKSTNNIEGGIYWKEHLTATTELHQLAKAANPNVETLLCSWNPPTNLKSNGKQEGGTLKKGPNGFLYNEFGTYWNDVLDHVGFNPDYISIQNEPGFTTSGWGTCQWRPTETADLPGYDKALDAVYNTIKNRANLPKLIGPETENIGSADWNSSLNLYREFAKPVKARPYISAYAFHPYNFHNSPNNLDNSLLNIIKNEFNDRPTMMTEFSGGNFKWLQTADAIQTMLVQANISTYIFWQMMWVPNSDAMIEIDDAGNYTVGNQYYAIKHFSKYIDKDYKRISVANVNPNVKVTGFMSPDGGTVTLVYLNNSAVDVTVTSSLAGHAISSSQMYQSDGNTFFQNKGAVPATGKIVLPKASLTTVVLNVVSTNCQASLTSSGPLTFCAGGSVVLTANAGSSYKWYRESTLLPNTTQTLTATASGQYFAQVTQATGCSAATSRVSVVVNALPSATVSAPTNAFCEGSSLVLTASTGSGFKWYNNNVLLSGNLRTQTITTGGSYTVEVSNAMGCKVRSAPRVITLNLRPVLTPNLKKDSETYFQLKTANATLCAGDGITFAPWPVSTSSWSWTGPNGFKSSIRNPTISPISATQAGTYEVMYTDAKGCSARLTYTIAVQPLKTWYADADGDGKGDPSVAVQACNRPQGYVAVAGDACPSDASKTAPGNCGCGIAESICAPLAAGTYQIKPLNNLTYALAAGSTSVIQGTSDATALNQRWILVPTAIAGQYSIKNASTNAYLTPNSLTFGSRLNAFASAPLVWKLEFAGVSADGKGTFRMMPVSDMSKIVHNKTATAVNLFLGATADVPNQKFVFDYLSSAMARESEEETNSNASQSDCYPNPFENQIRIQANGAFSYTVTNLAGLEIEKGAGENQIYTGTTWESGIYFIRVQTGEQVVTKKVVKH